jgi:hypothetical protein
MYTSDPKWDPDYMGSTMMGPVVLAVHMLWIAFGSLVGEAAAPARHAIEVIENASPDSPLIGASWNASPDPPLIGAGWQGAARRRHGINMPFQTLSHIIEGFGMAVSRPWVHCALLPQLPSLLKHPGLHPFHKEPPRLSRCAASRMICICDCKSAKLGIPPTKPWLCT